MCAGSLSLLQTDNDTNASLAASAGRKLPRTFTADGPDVGSSGEVFAVINGVAVVSDRGWSRKDPFSSLFGKHFQGDETCFID